MRVWVDEAGDERAEGEEGIQSRRRSRAKQWGRRGERFGLRRGLYGCGEWRGDAEVDEAVGSVRGESNRGPVRCLREGLVDELVLELVLCSGSLEGLMASARVGGTSLRVGRVERGPVMLGGVTREVNDVGEEGEKGRRDGNSRKEVIAVGKDATGGSVGWVGGT